MKQRNYSPEYKARVVLEVLREELTISEIAAREQLGRTQVQNWKKEFIDNVSRVFSQNKIEREAQRDIREAQDREEELMKKVGQLTIENDWLKKKSAQIFGNDWETKSGFSK